MRTLPFLLVAALCVLALRSPAQSVPPLINYQGQIQNPDGTAPPTADYTLTFRIFDVASGGTAVWGPQVFDGQAGPGHGPKIPVVQGYFNVMLGPNDTTGRSLANAFDASSRFIEITVSNRPPVSPRQQILSAPFALKAGNSDKLAGYDWSSLLSANDPVNGKLSGSKIANDSVTSGQIANDAVGTVELQNNAVTTAKILDLAVVETKLANSAVSTRTIQSAAVTSGAIADGAVINAKILDGAVTSAKIANAAIQDSHIGILSHLTASDGNPAQALVVDATGRVGIGTNSPAANLDVAGTLKIIAMAQQSMGSNGYVQIGDLIIQWGQEATSHDVAEQTTTLTFPRSFPNQVFVVIPGIVTVPGFARGVGITVQGFNQSTVTLQWDEWWSLVQSVRASYIAIGR